jgi:hypothetical protein
VFKLSKTIVLKKIRFQNPIIPDSTQGVTEAVFISEAVLHQKMGQLGVAPKLLTSFFVTNTKPSTTTLQSSRCEHNMIWGGLLVQRSQYDLFAHLFEQPNAQPLEWAPPLLKQFFTLATKTNIVPFDLKPDNVVISNQLSYKDPLVQLIDWDARLCGWFSTPRLGSIQTRVVVFTFIFLTNSVLLYQRTPSPLSSFHKKQFLKLFIFKKKNLPLGGVGGFATFL